MPIIATTIISSISAKPCFRLEPEDHALIVDADTGKAEAQCDLALQFLMQSLPTEAAQWLTAAANQTYPEAMHQLGRCYITGTGVEANEAVGIEWISRAAALGHSTALHIAQYLMDPNRPAMHGAALDARLDAIEQQVVFAALWKTGSFAGGGGILR